MLMLARDDDGQPMTEQQLRDEVITLLLAGHETTALALSWTWYLLSQHPEVDAKLTAELREVLGGRAPTVSDLPRLRYAEQVVTEAMRIYPPAWGFGREALADCEIGGYAIPRRHHGHRQSLGVAPQSALLRGPDRVPSRALGATTSPPRCRASPTSRSAAGRASASATALR